METKTGTIKSIATKEGQGFKGPWTRWEFEMEDGKKYSTFDNKIGLNFKPGNKIVMTGHDVEKNGKTYWTMVAMALDDGVNSVNANISPIVVDASKSRASIDTLDDRLAYAETKLDQMHDLLRRILAELQTDVDNNDKDGE